MFDVSPFYRNSVGFDRLFSLMDSLMADQPSPGTPPYNIEKTGNDRYRVTIAVPGYAPDALSVETRENQLIVSGSRREATGSDAAGDGDYLHRGITQGSFRRSFQLAEFVEVVAADLDNGLLHIDLVREVPEALKPRHIKIQTSAPARLMNKAKRLVEKVKDAA
jgi:molecular chaperone IbpA